MRPPRTAFCPAGRFFLHFCIKCVETGLISPVFYVKFCKNAEFMEEIIREVKLRRRELGLTLRDVAELTGLGIDMLSRFERGSGGISLRHLEQVLETLGLALRVEVQRRAE